jgi:hypothetical protein
MTASVGRTLLAAARLDLAAYRSIAAERRFWGAAVVLVSLSAISHAALGVAWATEGGWAVARSVVPAAVSQFATWLGVSVAAYAVGHALGSTGSFGAVFRAVGVAQLATVFYVVGVPLPAALLVMGAWWLATTYLALRAALCLERWRSLPALAASAAAAYVMASLATTTVLNWLE